MPCGWVAGAGNGQICHTGRTRGVRQSSISRDLSSVPGQPSEQRTRSRKERDRPEPVVLHDLGRV
jgi:hypothetical protein